MKLIINAFVIAAMALSTGITQAAVTRKVEEGQKSYTKGNLTCRYLQGYYQCHDKGKPPYSGPNAKTHYDTLECEWCRQDTNKTQDSACSVCSTQPH